MEIISDWITRIDQITEDVKSEFGKLTADQLNQKPAPASWSIAQNLDHLIVINETYFPLLKAVREGKLRLPWFSKLNFMVTFSGNLILKAVEPERKRKMKTFPVWEPSKSELPANIVDRFTKHQEKLKKMIKESEDLLEQNIIISSPANKNIVYRLRKAFEIIVTHEKRHFNQAMEVKKAIQRSTKKATQ